MQKLVSLEWCPVITVLRVQNVNMFVTFSNYKLVRQILYYNYYPSQTISEQTLATPAARKY